MSRNAREMLSSLGTDIKDDNTVKGAEGFIVSLHLFPEAARLFKESGARLMAEWATDESPFGGGYAVLAAYALDSGYAVVKSALSRGETLFPSLSKVFPASVRLERVIHSLMGLTPEGHPDLRPWIKHEDWPEDAWPLRKDFDGKKQLPRVNGIYKWVRAEGEGVYEIPVGPVHAGIIEPGHFRFQAVGEDIINLETRFGYVHKGIEKRFESLDWKEAVRLAGRVSGDSTVAHSIAFARAAEAASGCVIPERAAYLRAVMTELERIANHLGDIGAICNDTAMTFIHNQMSVLRERMLRASMSAFGHRLMMDRVVIGGVACDITPGGANTILKELDGLSGEFERLVRIYEDNPSVEDRVYDTGVLTPDLARVYGMVGYVARASGQGIDARTQNPFPPYDRFAPKVPTLTSGDVHARAWVRVEEVRESLRLIKAVLSDLPEGPVSVRWDVPPEGASGFSAVEGWRGEIVYWVLAGPGGSISRVAPRDPSALNWIAIELAIKGNIVPDFPLCNKSFNQSYSGHDL